MTNSHTYSSKIIKAGALIPDTKTLFANWNSELSIAENLNRFRSENIFGKASRSRIEDILTIFRQRFFPDPSVGKSLSILVRKNFSTEALTKIFYFHAAQSDNLLHDIVTEFFYPRYLEGEIEILIEEVQQVVAKWVRESKTTAEWSDYTILRVSQGLMSTLRDFGILQGAVNKSIAPGFLPIEAFAYVAFFLKQKQPSGDLLRKHPEWRLYFFSPELVERFFIEAHQHNLLDYQAAGSIIRITFPAASLEEYAHVISKRTY